MSKAFETDKHGYKVADVDAYIAETNAAAAAFKERIAELKKEICEKDTELKSFKQKQELIVKSIMNAAEKAEQIEQLIKQKFAAEMAHLNAFHEQWLDYYKKLIETYPLSSQLSGLSQFNRRMSAILCGDEEPERKFAQAREQFESENMRINESENMRINDSESMPLKKKYIGYIPVDEDKDEDVYKDIPDFDPEESIRQLLRRQISEENAKQAAVQKKSAVQSAGKGATSGHSSKAAPKIISKTVSQKSQSKPVPPKKNPVAATVNTRDLGVSDTGFSFDEALNPTQDLSDILKEIGLKLGD